jgi:Flp pilus assembly pilin Flp
MKVATEPFQGSWYDKHLAQIGVISPRKGGESSVLYLRLQQIVASAFKRQEGQTMAEYAVIVAVVLLGAVAAFTILRDQVLSAVDGAASLI